VTESREKGSRRVSELPIPRHVTDDAQTGAIPRVPTPVVAARGPEVAQPEPEVARTKSVQEMHEAALSKMKALHDCWAAAMADIREVQPSGETGEAAA
jgi:hypothetical protein